MRNLEGVVGKKLRDMGRKSFKIFLTYTLYRVSSDLEIRESSWKMNSFRDHGKLRENYEYLCFALTVVKFVCSVDQKWYNFFNVVFKNF